MASSQEQKMSLAASYGISLRLQRRAGLNATESATVLDQRSLPVPGERFEVPAGVLARLRKRSRFKRLTAGRVWHSMDVLPQGPAPSGLVGEALALLSEQRAEADRLASEAEDRRDRALFRGLEAREQGRRVDGVANDDAVARAADRRLARSGRDALAVLSSPDAARAAPGHGPEQLRRATRAVAAAAAPQGPVEGTVEAEFGGAWGRSTEKERLSEAGSGGGAGPSDHGESSVLLRLMDPDARARATDPSFRHSLEPRSNFAAAEYRPGKGWKRQEKKADRRRRERERGAGSGGSNERGWGAPDTPDGTGRGAAAGPSAVPARFSVPPRLARLLEAEDPGRRRRGAGARFPEQLESSEEEEAAGVLARAAAPGSHAHGRGATPAERLASAASRPAPAPRTGPLTAIRTVRRALKHGVRLGEVFGWDVRATSAGRRMERSVLLGLSQTGAKLEADRVTGVRTGAHRPEYDDLSRGALRVAAPALDGGTIHRGGGLPLSYFGFKGKTDAAGVRAVKGAARRGLRGLGATDAMGDSEGTHEEAEEHGGGSALGGLAAEAAAQAASAEGRSAIAAADRARRWERLRQDSVLGCLLAPWTVPEPSPLSPALLRARVQAEADGSATAGMPHVLAETEVMLCRVPTSMTTTRMGAAAAIGAADEPAEKPAARRSAEGAPSGAGATPLLPGPDLATESRILGAAAAGADSATPPGRRRAALGLPVQIHPRDAFPLDVELYRLSRRAICAQRFGGDDCERAVEEFRQSMRAVALRAEADEALAGALQEPSEVPWAWEGGGDGGAAGAGANEGPRRSTDLIEATGRVVRVRLVGSSGAVVEVKLTGPPVTTALAPRRPEELAFVGEDVSLSAEAAEAAAEGRTRAVRTGTSAPQPPPADGREMETASLIGRAAPDPEVTADAEEARAKGVRQPWAAAGRVVGGFHRFSPGTAAAVRRLPMQGRVALALVLMGSLEASLGLAVSRGRAAVSRRRVADLASRLLHGDGETGRGALRDGLEATDAEAAVEAAARLRRAQRRGMRRGDGSGSGLGQGPGGPGPLTVMTSSEAARCRGELRAAVSRELTGPAANAAAAEAAEAVWRLRAREEGAAEALLSLLAESGPLQDATASAAATGDATRARVARTPARYRRGGQAPSPVRRAQGSLPALHARSPTALAGAGSRPGSASTAAVIRDGSASRHMWNSRAVARARRAGGVSGSGEASASRGERLRAAASLRRFVTAYEAAAARAEPEPEDGGAGRRQAAILAEAPRQVPAELSEAELMAIHSSQAHQGGDGEEDDEATLLEIGLGMPRKALTLNALKRLQATAELFRSDEPLQPQERARRPDETSLPPAAAGGKQRHQDGPVPSSGGYGGALGGASPGVRLVCDLDAARRAAAEATPLSLPLREGLAIALRRQEARRKAMAGRPVSAASSLSSAAPPASHEALMDSLAAARAQLAGEVAAGLASRLGALQAVLEMPLRAHRADPALAWVTLQAWLASAHQLAFSEFRRCLERVEALVGAELSRAVKFQGVPLAEWERLARPQAGPADPA